MLDHLPSAFLIARGRELRNLIDAAEAELKQIDDTLRSRALAMPHEPLAQGNREGRRAIIRDGDQKVSVLFESDILKASFAADSPVAQSLLPLLSKDQISNLFRVKKTYERSIKDGYKFRLQCSEILDPDLAALVIDKLKDRDRNGIVKSKSVIEWKAV